jgi:hypothetical protein
MRGIFSVLFLSFVLSVPERKKCGAVYPNSPPTNSPATNLGSGKPSTGTGTGIQGSLAQVLGRQSKYIDTFNPILKIFKFKEQRLPYEKTTNEHIEDIVKKLQEIYSKNSYGQVKIDYEIYNDWVMYNPSETQAVTAEKQSGIKQNYPNTHFVFILNWDKKDGWGGLEGGRYLFMPEQFHQYSLAHELGHSIGFYHSTKLNDGDDYADRLSIMGNGPDPDAPLFPAPFRQFAGWLADTAIVLIDYKVPKSVTLHEIYTSSASDVISIEYKRRDESKYYTRPKDDLHPYVLYAEYYTYHKNGPKGTKIAESKIFIRVANAPMPRNDKDDGVILGTTLLATLGEGESYTDNKLDGITITAKNFNSASAVVDVSWA